MVRKAVLLAFALALTLPAGTSLAQSPEMQAAADSAFERRAAQLVDVLDGSAAFADYFDPTFQSAVPEAQFKAMTASLIAQYGQPIAAEKLMSNDGRSGSLLLRFEKGVGTVLLDVGADPDARVIGLRLTGFEMANDSFDTVAAEIAALPGSTGFLIAELTGDAIRPLASANPDQQFAVGSTFKLYILNELAAQVAAKKTPLVRCGAAVAPQFFVDGHRELAKRHAGDAAKSGELDDLGQRQQRDRHADSPTWSRGD